MIVLPRAVCRSLLPVLYIAAMLVLPGCGGGGGAAPPQAVAAADTGPVTIAVRDADGDFLSYAVDVTSLRLQRANGDVVETLPRATRIDFAELVELTEFLTSATVPTGSYTHVVVGLDFRTADIIVQDDAGEPRAATVVDEDGMPLARFEVRIELPTAEPIRIAAATAAYVTLDFDLEASNEVDWGVAPPRVTVAPFLSVVPELERDREHRVRGLLAMVDEANQTVTLAVRPFRHRDGDFGRLRFATDGATRYEINGAEYAGAEGLAALADLPDATPVVAQGPVDDRLLTADVVLAGDSVPWSDAEGMRGVVTARVGNTLEVLGRVFDVPRNVDELRRRVAVVVGDTTAVTAPGLGLESPDIADISVGSRIAVSGEFADDGTLDATEGRVRLAMNNLVATVREVTPLVVDLYRLNGLRPAVFDFGGTGVALAEDSDPEAYEIETSTLALAGIDSGDLVRVRGRVAPFGLAPPDFEARTVIDVDLESNPALLAVGWLGGTANPFVAMAPDRLDIDLSRARYALVIRGIPVDYLAGADSVALLPGPRPAVYAVTVRGSRELRLFRTFAATVDALQAELDRGARMRRIVAGGRYNADTAEMSTPRAGFELSAP